MIENNEKPKAQGIRQYPTEIGKNQVGSAVKVDDIANYRNVLNDAQRLIQKKEYSLAIVRVITAFEVFILNKILILNPSDEENIQKVLDTKKFKEKLVEYLEHKKIVPNGKEWNSYCIAQKQRNAVVHLGRDFTQKEAELALEKITSLITLLKD